MAKVMIEVEIPDYEVKYCEDFSEDVHCKFLGNYDYGLKYYCILSGKILQKLKIMVVKFADHTDADV
jgi:hypothetical protein